MVEDETDDNLKKITKSLAKSSMEISKNNKNVSIDDLKQFYKLFRVILKKIPQVKKADFIKEYINFSCAYLYISLWEDIVSYKEYKNFAVRYKAEYGKIKKILAEKIKDQDAKEPLYKKTQYVDINLYVMWSKISGKSPVEAALKAHLNKDKNDIFCLLNSFILTISRIEVQDIAIRDRIFNPFRNIKSLIDPGFIYEKLVDIYGKNLNPNMSNDSNLLKTDPSLYIANRFAKEYKFYKQNKLNNQNNSANKLFGG